jgi:hypothetical protein
MAAASVTRRHDLPLAMGLPGAFLLPFFALPVLRLFALSIEDGTFAPYLEIAQDDFYAFVLWKTFRIGTVVMVVAVLTGYPLPELSDVKISFCWTGNVGMSADHIPHMGTVDGVHYAVGCNGSGSR